MGKVVFSYVKVFGIAIAIGIALLYLVSFIPQSLVEGNIKHGREDYYRKDFPLFKLTVQDDYSTYIDNGMDELMVDAAHKIGEPGINVLNPSLYGDITNRRITYGRYWHGYTVIIRPLFIFMDKAHVMSFLGIVLWVLFFILMGVLIYNKQYLLVLGIGFGAYMAHFEIICKGLEYMFCGLIMLGFSIYVCLKREMSFHFRCLLYFIIGICVAYFDFLTFETMSLTLPLIVDLSVHKDFKFKDLFFSCMTWGLGYAFTFITKFALVYFVGDEGDFNYMMYKAFDKVDMEGFSIKEALVANFDMLRFSSETSVWIIFLIVCAIVAYIMGTYYKQNLYLLFIACIPVLRFVVLSGQSGSHCMFTYHALWALVTALCMLLLSPLKCFVFDKRFGCV